MYFLHFQNPVIFRILAYLEPEIYSELCQGILWPIQNVVNARILRTLPNSEFWQVSDPKHIHKPPWVYLTVIVIITLTFTLILYTFPRNL